LVDRTSAGSIGQPPRDLEEAKSVDDALNVHKQLAQVRGEIERLEGKRRLLRDQVMLSVIDVRLVRQQPLLAVKGSRFGRALVEAGADAVNVGAGIVVGAVRLVGVLVTVTVLILVPLAWMGRRLVRRFSRVRSVAHG